MKKEEEPPCGYCTAACPWVNPASMNVVCWVSDLFEKCGAKRPQPILTLDVNMAR